MLLTLCPSVHPSVRHIVFITFLSSYHRGVSRCYYHWQKWCPYKWSRPEFKGQGDIDQNKFCPDLGVSRTPVWIERWLRNNAQRLKWIQLLFFKGHLSNFKVLMISKMPNQSILNNNTFLQREFPKKYPFIHIFETDDGILSLSFHYYLGVTHRCFLSYR